MSFLASMETQIVTNLAGLATAFSSNLSSAARPLFVAAATIYILMTGYEVAWGKTDDSITYLLTKLGKFMMVGTFAVFGWDSLAYPFFIDLPNWFQSATTGTVGIAAILEQAIWIPILNVFVSVWNSFLEIFTISGLTDSFLEGTAVIVMPIVGLIAGLCLVVVGAALSIVAFVMYAMPQSLMYITLALGPFFLMCAPFQVTQKFFESWVNALFTQAIAMTLVSILVTSASALMGLTAFATSGNFPVAGVTYDTSYGVVGAIFGKVFMAFIVCYLFKKSFDLASSLGGGMNFGGALHGLSTASFNRSKPNRAPAPEPAPNTLKGERSQPNLAQSAQQSLSNGARRLGSGVARLGNDGASVVSYAYNRAAYAARRKLA